MKHAVIIDENNADLENCIKVSNGSEICLKEAEYTEKELEEFNAEGKKWILRCSGSQSFLADRDSGEDAEGWYCYYFDLTPETAVFHNGRLVGCYVCENGFDYSGNGRASFSIDAWFFHNPFKERRYEQNTHVFLFDSESSHYHCGWHLLEREPSGDYESYLHFS